MSTDIDSTVKHVQDILLQLLLYCGLIQRCETQTEPIKRHENTFNNTRTTRV
jgi:hypothetical protein